MKKYQNPLQAMIFMGILSLLIVFIPLAKAQGGTIILNPTDDAYTDSNYARAKTTENG